MKLFMKLLAALISFVSAFFLFLVQPIMGRYFLPIFGGGSSVWIILVLCFQLLLVAGYYYAYRLSLETLKRQLIFHLLIAGVFLALQLFLSRNWLSTILPPDKLALNSSFSPEALLMALVFLGVGMFYFLLSVTSSLVQFWYSRTSKTFSPYWLYRYSNLGSLLALVNYPFLIEPNFGLLTQTKIWFFGFCFYLLMLGAYGWLILTKKKKIFNKKAARPSIAKTENRRTFLIWIGLSALSVISMMAFTNSMTRGIAPVPFLWLLPLWLYLFSFVVTFNDKFNLPQKLWAVGFILLIFFASLLSVDYLNVFPIIHQIVVYSFFLLLICLFTHTQLYQLKPKAQYLTSYYLAIALGGAFGGVFVGLVAPLIFPDYWEMKIVVFLAIFLMAKKVIMEPKSWWQRLYFNRDSMLCWVLSALVLLVAGLISEYSSVIYADRNFYGTVRVTQDEKITYLFNGTTLHGMQFLDPEKEELIQPASYYSPHSGVGLAFSLLNEKETSINVGVVGLGAGMLASYCRPNDSFTFYEINPMVIHVANKYFSYLKSCRQLKIVEGDGRISLRNELAAGVSGDYDLLVLDAFSDDSIPLHLLTKEAFEVHLKRLKPAGLLAIHISNRYLNLQPPLKRMAEFFNLEILLVEKERSEDLGGHPSTWIVFSRDIERLSSLTRFEFKNVSFKKSASMVGGDFWTDDFSNLLGALK